MMRPKRREFLRKGAIATGATMAGLETFSGKSLAGYMPEQGCTPGYWRNPAFRNSVWDATSYDPDENLEGVFTGPFEGNLGEMSLNDALGGGGGPGLKGVQRILFRAAVAALLNEAHPDIHYGFNGGRCCL